ncbi:TetR/AcrR family transcriptional regulator [Maricaulaceae bacterium NA33B04]|nr:TetR/AcrR family transcriptional regulator [Maricaulaceae bacterium NA33B04]
MTGRARGYHHGEVRSAALDAALDLLERNGPDAVTMRAVAKAVGVDHRALYRHFPDREALLSAVAATGYEALLKAFGAPGKASRPLHAAFAAYIDFALARPHLHALMLTRSRAAIDEDAALNAAVFAVLDHLMTGARTALGSGTTGAEAKSLALSGLASAYGMISLAATQTLMPRTPQAQRVFLVEQVHAVLDGRIARLGA